MRRIIGTIAATLAVAAAMATSATPASADCQGPGWYNCNYPSKKYTGVGLKADSNEVAVELIFQYQIDTRLGLGRGR
jgi:hypothetical protein